MNRYLTDIVTQDLKEKMVFLGGSRQVGKTTLALSLLEGGSETHPAYMNWDDVVSRRAFLQGALPSEENLVILDEIHKYKGWRNLVKGFYDTGKSRRQILIPGSLGGEGLRDRLVQGTGTSLYHPDANSRSVIRS